MSSNTPEFKPLLSTFPGASVCIPIDLFCTDQSVGYGVVIGEEKSDWYYFMSVLNNIQSIGVGFFFALIMLCLTFLQTRFTDTSPRASEEFAVNNSESLCQSNESLTIGTRQHPEMSRYATESFNLLHVVSLIPLSPVSSVVGCGSSYNSIRDHLV